jgi:hypothetical protein
MEAISVAVKHQADDRATSAARSTTDGEALGKLVVDVLLGQAQGRVTVSPAGYVAARAREHGLAAEQAETPFGNLLSILERGAESEGEADVVSAFFALGLGGRLAAEDEAKRPAALRALEPALDWLMAYTPYDVYAHVDRLCPEPVTRLVWDELARRTEEESNAAAPNDRIYRLLRTEVLGRTAPALREEICSRLASTRDPAVSALARAHLPGGAPSEITSSAAVVGRAGGRPAGRIRRLVALCSGYALLRAVASAVGRYLLGYRRTVDVSLAAKGVVCKKKVELLGKTIQEGEELVPWSGLASVEREQRYPYIYLLVGVGGLALGAIWGVLRIFDGIRGAYAPLALIGLLAIALGVAFDLGLSTLWPARRGRVSLTLLRAPKRWIRVVDVDGEAARRFVAAVDERLGRVKSASRDAA